MKSVNDSTKQAINLSAKLIVDPQDIPNIGRFSALNDPTGAGITLFTGNNS